MAETPPVPAALHHGGERKPRSAVAHGVVFGFCGVLIAAAMAIARAKFVPHYVEIFKQAEAELPAFSRFVWFTLLTQPVLSIVLPLLFVAGGVAVAFLRRRRDRWLLTIGAYAVLIVLFLLMIFSMYVALFDLPRIVR
ncbi:MAG: hypothetical protein RLY93_03745 [Sumerlaeia bacterium]